MWWAVGGGLCWVVHAAQRNITVTFGLFGLLMRVSQLCFDPSPADSVERMFTMM